MNDGLGDFYESNSVWWQHKQFLPESCSPEYTKYEGDFSLIPSKQTPKTYFN